MTGVHNGDSRNCTQPGRPSQKKNGGAVRALKHALGNMVQKAQKITTARHSGSVSGNTKAPADSGHSTHTFTLTNNGANSITAGMQPMGRHQDVAADARVPANSAQADCSTCLGSRQGERQSMPASAVAVRDTQSPRMPGASAGSSFAFDLPPNPMVKLSQQAALILMQSSARSAPSSNRNSLEQDQQTLLQGATHGLGNQSANLSSSTRLDSRLQKSSGSQAAPLLGRISHPMQGSAAGQPSSSSRRRQPGASAVAAAHAAALQHEQQQYQSAVEDMSSGGGDGGAAAQDNAGAGISAPCRRSFSQSTAPQLVFSPRGLQAPRGPLAPQGSLQQGAWSEAVSLTGRTPSTFQQPSLGVPAEAEAQPAPATQLPVSGLQPINAVNPVPAAASSAGLLSQAHTVTATTTSVTSPLRQPSQALAPAHSNAAALYCGNSRSLLYTGMASSHSLGGGEEARAAAEPEIQMVWPLCLTTGAGAPSLSVKVSNTEVVARQLQQCSTSLHQHGRLPSAASGAHFTRELVPGATSDSGAGNVCAAAAVGAGVSDRYCSEAGHDMFALRTESSIGLSDQLASLPDMRVCFMVDDQLLAELQVDLSTSTASGSVPPADALHHAALADVDSGSLSRWAAKGGPGSVAAAQGHPAVTPSGSVPNTPLSPFSAASSGSFPAAYAAASLTSTVSEAALAALNPPSIQPPSSGLSVVTAFAVASSASASGGVGGFLSGSLGHVPGASGLLPGQSPGVGGGSLGLSRSSTALLGLESSRLEGPGCVPGPAVSLLSVPEPVAFELHLLYAKICGQLLDLEQDPNLGHLHLRDTNGYLLYLRANGSTGGMTAPVTAAHQRTSATHAVLSERGSVTTQLTLAPASILADPPGVPLCSVTGAGLNQPSLSSTATALDGLFAGSQWAAGQRTSRTCDIVATPSITGELPVPAAPASVARNQSGRLAIIPPPRTYGLEAIDAWYEDALLLAAGSKDTSQPLPVNSPPLAARSSQAGMGPAMAALHGSLPTHALLPPPPSPELIMLSCLSENNPSINGSTPRAPRVPATSEPQYTPQGALTGAAVAAMLAQYKTCTPPWQLPEPVAEVAARAWTQHFSPLMRDLSYLVLCVPGTFDHMRMSLAGGGATPPPASNSWNHAAGPSWDRKTYCSSLARMVAFLEHHKCWHTLSAVLGHAAEQGVLLTYQGEPLTQGAITPLRVRVLLERAMHDDVSITYCPAAVAVAAAAAASVKPAVTEKVQPWTRGVWFGSSNSGRDADGTASTAPGDGHVIMAAAAGLGLGSNQGGGSSRKASSLQEPEYMTGWDDWRSSQDPNSGSEAPSAWGGAMLGRLRSAHLSLGHKGAAGLKDQLQHALAAQSLPGSPRPVSRVSRLAGAAAAAVVGLVGASSAGPGDQPRPHGVPACSSLGRTNHAASQPSLHALEHTTVGDLQPLDQLGQAGDRGSNGSSVQARRSVGNLDDGLTAAAGPALALLGSSPAPGCLLLPPQIGLQGEADYGVLPRPGSGSAQPASIGQDDSLPAGASTLGNTPSSPSSASQAAGRSSASVASAATSEGRGAAKGGTMPPSGTPAQLLVTAVKSVNPLTLRMGQRVQQGIAAILRLVPASKNTGAAYPFGSSLWHMSGHHPSSQQGPSRLQPITPRRSGGGSYPGQAQHQQEVNPDRWFVQMVVEHLVAIALIALVMLRAYL